MHSNPNQLLKIIGQTLTNNIFKTFINIFYELKNKLNNKWKFKKLFKQKIRKQKKIKKIVKYKKNNKKFKKSKKLRKFKKFKK